MVVNSADIVAYLEHRYPPRARLPSNSRRARACACLGARGR
jgi:glutathione S-transferase